MPAIFAVKNAITAIRGSKTGRLDNGVKNVTVPFYVDETRPPVACFNNTRLLEK